MSLLMSLKLQGWILSLLKSPECSNNRTSVYSAQGESHSGRVFLPSYLKGKKGVASRRAEGAERMIVSPFHLGIGPTLFAVTHRGCFTDSEKIFMNGVVIVSNTCFWPHTMLTGRKTTTKNK